MCIEAFCIYLGWPPMPSQYSPCQPQQEKHSVWSCNVLGVKKKQTEPVKKIKVIFFPYYKLIALSQGSAVPLWIILLSVFFFVEMFTTRRGFSFTWLSKITTIIAWPVLMRWVKGTCQKQQWRSWRHCLRVATLLPLHSTLLNMIFRRNTAIHTCMPLLIEQYVQTWSSVTGN